MKLGRKPFVPDERDITFKQVTEGITLPTPPMNFGHGLMFGDGEYSYDWQMNGNGPDNTVAPGFQGAGDCVEAMMAHVTREANKLGGHPVSVTGKESIKVYSEITGYVLDDSSTDNGTDMRTAMGYWRSTGMLDTAGNRHKIGAYVSINPTDINELWQACYVFSAVAIGFNFQQAQYHQFGSGTWDYDPSSTVDGGHCVPCFGRNNGRVGLVSWANHVWGTKAFYQNLNEEAWAFVFPDELRKGKTERGLDLAQLNTLLGQLR